MSLVLLVADDGDAHANAVARALARRGARALPLVPSDVPTRVTLSWRPDGRGADALRGPFGVVPVADVSAAFLRPARPPAPGPWTDDPARTEWTRTEARVGWESFTALLSGRWMPASPAEVRAASVKATQVAAARACGLATPRTLVTNDPDAVAAFWEETGGCMVSKTLQARRADVDGVPRFAFTHDVARRHLTNLGALRNGPVILQERIPKRTEIRAAVVGERVLAGEVDSQAVASTRGDWRRLADPPLRWSTHDLPPQVCDGLLGLHRRLGISCSGVDLVLTPAGDYVFLEANPLGDWLFLEERTAHPVTETVVDHLLSGLAARGSPGGPA